LQDWDCDETPHEAPPFCGCVRDLVLVCEPVPQVEEQLPQFPQLPSTQFTGQLKALQDWDCDAIPHAAPPCCGCVRDLVLVWEPVPQVREQLPQFPQLPSTQFTGQLKVLQDWDCDATPHAAPPCCGWVRDLVLVWEPVPQVREQLPQPPQLPSTQFTGQLNVLHDCDCVDTPQALPPVCGCCNVLVLPWVPVPQVREHVAQEDQSPSTQSCAHVPT
jgi:hypothetical protein